MHASASLAFVHANAAPRHAHAASAAHARQLHLLGRSSCLCCLRVLFHCVQSLKRKLAARKAFVPWGGGKFVPLKLKVRSSM